MRKETRKTSVMIDEACLVFEFDSLIFGKASIDFIEVAIIFWLQ